MYDNNDNNQLNNAEKKLADADITKMSHADIIALTCTERLKMYDSLKESGALEKPGGVRVANELLGSIDDAVYKKTALEAKSEENSALAALGGSVVDVLRALSTSAGQQALSSAPKSIGNIRPDNIPTNVKTVPDELAIHPEPLDKEEFINTRKGN